MADGKENTTKPRRLWLLLSLGFLISIIGVAGFLFYPITIPDIPPGTVVQETNLSNLTRKEGRLKLAVLEEQIGQEIITINYHEFKHDFTLSSLGFTIDADTTIDLAVADFNERSFLKRRLANWLPESYYQPVISFNRDMVRAEMQRLADPLYYPAIDASLLVNDAEQFEITPSQTGFKVEVDQLTKQLIDLVDGGQDLALTLPTTIIQPEIDEEDVASWGVNGLIAQYTTRFNSSLYSRTNNIKIAAAVFDNLLLSPDQFVSFNEIVGPREASRGYQVAAVVIGNQFGEDYGGGICQVSTTLYNAILLAGMEPIERSSHSLPISYAPAGLDAAVSYGSLDFSFKNTTGRYTIMRTFVQGNQITVKIYGNLEEKKNIELNSWVTNSSSPPVRYVEDSSLTPGTTRVVRYGSGAYGAAAQRLFLDDNGQVIEKEALSSSSYGSTEQVIARNSSLASPAATVTASLE